MTCGIYKITNLINNKVYIGQSKNIERRKYRHFRNYNDNIASATYNNHLYSAMRKYGKENFLFEIIEECLPEQLNEKEKFFIHLYDSSNIEKGYNKTKGGSDTYLNTTKHGSLTYDIVLDIISELKNSKLSTDKIGKKYGVSGRAVRAINTGESWYNPNIQYPIRITYLKKYCKNCGKELSDKTATLCRECYSISQRKVKERPSREELKDMIRTLPFVQIGLKYGVNDNTIRKWCKKVNLPFRSREIKQFSDDEWERI